MTEYFGQCKVDILFTDSVLGHLVEVSEEKVQSRAVIFGQFINQSSNSR